MSLVSLLLLIPLLIGGPSIAVEDVGRMNDFLESWREAQVQKDFAAYSRLYDEEFTGIRWPCNGEKRVLDRTEWLGEMGRVIPETRGLDVQIRDVKVSMRDRIGTLRFKQLFLSLDGFCQVSKIIMTRTEEGVPKIIYESEEPDSKVPVKERIPGDWNLVASRADLRVLKTGLGLVSENGAGLRRPAAPEDVQPMRYLFSPDGTHLIVGAWRTDEFCLYALNLETGEYRLLDADIGAYSCSFGPGSDELVCQRKTAVRESLEIYCLMRYRLSDGRALMYREVSPEAQWDLSSSEQPRWLGNGRIEFGLKSGAERRIASDGARALRFTHMRNRVVSIDDAAWREVDPSEDEFWRERLPEPEIEPEIEQEQGIQ